MLPHMVCYDILKGVILTVCNQLNTYIYLLYYIAGHVYESGYCTYIVMFVAQVMHLLICVLLCTNEFCCSLSQSVHV